VQITTAAIAYDVFGDKESITILIQALKNTNPHLALTAANYLLYIKDKQPFIPDILTLKKTKGIDNNLERAINDFLLIIQTPKYS